MEALAPPVPGAETTPIPSHLRNESGPEMESGSPETESAPDTYRYQRSKIGGLMTAAILIVLLAIGVVGGIIGLALLDSNNEQQQQEQRKAERETTKVNYTLAGKKRVRLGGLEVGVKLVEYGPLRVKDQANRVHISDSPHLQIHLELRSRRSTPVKYVSWYGRSFPRGSSQNVVAELKDQDGTSYNMPVYEDIKGLFGHVDEAVLEKSQRIQDCIIFELPENRKITDIKELYLTLPMECVGSDGDIRFLIPQEFITLVEDAGQ